MLRFGGNRFLREVAPSATLLLAAGAAGASTNVSVQLQSDDHGSSENLLKHISTIPNTNGTFGFISKWTADRLFSYPFETAATDKEDSAGGQCATHESTKTTISVASLIRPTFEATCRAIRLVSTFASIAIDYEVLPHLPYFLQQEGHSDHDEETTQQRIHWEQQVHFYTKQLQVAQDEYTKPSAGTAKPTQERKQEVHSAAQLLGEAEANLLLCGGRRKTHERSAQKLLRLCRDNGGVYIKVGQHLANLDYLIPYEYIDALQELFDSAPVSSYENVLLVLKEELGRSPEELFDNFSIEPIASASLAQVHVAYDKVTGKKLAIKIQHKGLRETSQGDLFAVSCIARAADFFFRDFTLGWLIDEMLPQLPKELNFVLEGMNAVRASGQLGCSTDIVIPKVIWEKTTPRVLCMEFEEGFKCTDIQAIEQAGLQKSDISKLISTVFHSQVFLSGFVHSDPHPANVLVRKHPNKSGKPQLVLVDHGLYKEIDDDFRVLYAHLYKSLLMADVSKIKSTCEKLGITKMHTLLSAMLTSRPFDEIIERNKSGGSLYTKQNQNGTGEGDKAMIRGYAQTYFSDIIAMLDIVPRQMLLLFKMNDCLRHLDFALGIPSSQSLIISGRLAALAVLNDEMKRHSNNLIRKVFVVAEYMHLLLRIKTLEIFQWWSTALQNGYSSLLHLNIFVPRH